MSCRPYVTATVFLVPKGALLTFFFLLFFLVELGRPLGVDDNDVDVDLPIPVDDEELPAYYEGTLPERAEPSLMAGFVALTALYKIAGQPSFSHHMERG